MLAILSSSATTTPICVRIGLFVISTLAFFQGRLMAQQASAAKNSPIVWTLTSEIKDNPSFQFFGDKQLILATPQGIEFQQPIGSSSDKNKLLVIIPPTELMSIGIDFKIERAPQAGPEILSGLMMRLQFEDQAINSPVFGFASTQLGLAGFLSSSKPIRELKDALYSPNPLQEGELRVMKSIGQLSFAVGSSSLSMIPLGSVSCPDSPVKGIEFFSTACHSDQTKAVFRFRRMELITDEFYTQPRPVDYWQYTWPIKWIISLSILAWLLRAVWRNPEILKRKIF
jgi:hypothetical protein